jgi:alpha-L-fucosidase 2
LVPIFKFSAAMKLRHSALFVALALAGFLPAETFAAQPTETTLKLTAPIDSWDEAVPLGNGLTGGLLWGSGSTLRLSLDRGDLWDERPAKAHDPKLYNYATLLKLKADGKFAEMNKILEAPYREPFPTKLPAGRIEFDLDPETKLTAFSLNLAGAEARADSDKGVAVTAFFHANRPVAMLWFPKGVKNIRLLSTGDVARASAGAAKESSSGGGTAKLGYPEAVKGEDADARWYLQEAADKLKYCVYIQKLDTPYGPVCAVAITSTKDGADPLAIARKRAKEALDEGYDNALNSHRGRWQNFWSKSRVTVPDADIQRQYDTAQYFYGAASRRGAPPMPLQGVWTADHGQLPPWKGDYHNDLNTQMTYIAYQAAGHFEEGASYLDFLWKLRPKFQKFAKEFYGTEGANTPGVMTLAGNPLGGWGQYSTSPTMGAWSAHLFYLHWCHTRDDKFLAERAYPWCKDVGVSIKQLLKPDESGRLVLPLSSSPEIFDNSAKAWLIPNSNYDLMSLRMLFLALHEMADAQQLEEESADWAALADKLGDYHAAPDGRLLVDAKTALPSSHRHLSNLIGIYPFNLITVEGSDEDRRRIKASLAEWDKLGTRGWVGYSFSWMSCLRARVGDSEGALKHLKIFTEAFISRNGFHLNGDQLKKGYSGFTYKPFTLEGNFLAAQAVQEMLLQSWSPTPGVRDTGVIRIFPATPKEWADAAFEELRAEGGFIVTAKRAGGKTVSFRIDTPRDGVIRIRDNFGGRNPIWSVEGVRKVGDNFEFSAKAGQTLAASFKE